MNAKLYRSATDHKIAGVCGGLGAHLKIDPRERDHECDTHNATAADPAR
jgi:hypothetical protein